jgi:hypothetical protein
MLAEVMRTGYVEQESMVWDIAKRFGKEFIYDNENGNPAIDKKVLRAFKKKSNPTVVYSRSERAWRKRERYDEPGRRQD